MSQKIDTLTEDEQALLDEIVGDHKNGALEEIIGKLHDEVARLRENNSVKNEAKPLTIGTRELIRGAVLKHSQPNNSLTVGGTPYRAGAGSRLESGT